MNATFFTSKEYWEREIAENAKKDGFVGTGNDLAVNTVASSTPNTYISSNYTKTLEKNQLLNTNGLVLKNTMLKSVKDQEPIVLSQPVVIASDLSDVKEGRFLPNDIEMINPDMRTNSDGLAQFIEDNKFPQELLFALHQEQCFTTDGIPLLSQDRLLVVASTMKVVQRLKFLNMFGVDKVIFLIHRLIHIFIASYID